MAVGVVRYGQGMGSVCQGLQVSCCQNQVLLSVYLFYLISSRCYILCSFFYRSNRILRHPDSSILIRCGRLYEVHFSGGCGVCVNYYAVGIQNGNVPGVIGDFEIKNLAGIGRYGKVVCIQFFPVSIFLVSAGRIHALVLNLRHTAYFVRRRYRNFCFLPEKPFPQNTVCLLNLSCVNLKLTGGRCQIHFDNRQCCRSCNISGSCLSQAIGLPLMIGPGSRIAKAALPGCSAIGRNLVTVSRFQCYL